MSRILYHQCYYYKLYETTRMTDNYEILEEIGELVITIMLDCYESNSMLSFFFRSLILSLNINQYLV